MSAELARSARAASKAKASRMANGDPHQKVDGSSWTEAERMDNDVQTGERPVSRRQYAAGGKVGLACGGSASPRNAGRSARATGGKAVVNDYVNRNVRDANESREGKKHVGGFADGGVPTSRFNFSPTAPGEMARAGGLATGGRAHPDAAQDKKMIDTAIAKHAKGCRCAKCMGGVARASGGSTFKGGVSNGGANNAGDRLPRKSGGGNWIAGATKNKGALHRALGVPEGEKIPAKKLEKAEHSKNPTMRKRADLAETLKGMHKAAGGPVALKRGGRANGKMNVNIVIAPGGKDQAPPPPMAAGPPPPIPAPPMMPPRPPMGMPMGMPLGAGPPMGGMSPGGLPPGMPPPMSRKSGGRAQPAGAGGGEGRLEKIRDYGSNARKLDGHY